MKVKSTSDKLFVFFIGDSFDRNKNQFEQSQMSKVDVLQQNLQNFDQNRFDNFAKKIISNGHFQLMLLSNDTLLIFSISISDQEMIKLNLEFFLQCWLVKEAEIGTDLKSGQ